MRAVIAERPGGPEVLRYVEDLPDPVPGAGRVRIAVEYAAITFIDTRRRAGRSPGPPVEFPVVLGNGVGGVVDRIGDDVDPEWLGARVVSTTGGGGGYADLALANVTDAHRVPDRLSLADATAVLADGRTAIGLCEAAAIRPRETVVVTAAAGGVGGILVQLATASGARVIGLAGSPAKLAEIRDQGATAIDYRATGWVEELAAGAPNGVDVVFDGVGGATTDHLFRSVREGGRYLQHGAAGGSWGTIDADVASRRHVTVIPLAEIGAGPGEMAAFTARALSLAADGGIRARIGQTFPLSEADRAHTAIEARTTIGKTLLLT
ncbi:zinc-binding dehydrogenase [Nocardiopsis alba]|uniref:zinc-binding dehydrogenase n=1 Tax=Nocardiopsis alba TaxID=53437 RepID=UPI003649FA03